MISKSFAALALLGAASVSAKAAAPQQRPPITGIAYVRFFESDLARAKVFYGQRLGLPETDHADGGATFAVGARQQVAVAPLPSPAPSSRLDEVAFLTSDIAAMKRFLAMHSVAFETVDAHEIRLKDPIGTRIGFVEPAAASNALPKTQTGAATISSKRLIHAGWRVRDRVAEDAFYQGLLGFRPYWYGGAQPGRTDWVSLQVPDGTDWIEYMLQFHADAGRHELGVLDHISLGVEKITQATDRLVANGWSDVSTRVAQQGKDGKWQLNVFDPDETRVEFMEFQPAGPACCSPYTAAHPVSDSTD